MTPSSASVLLMFILELQSKLTELVVTELIKSAQTVFGIEQSGHHYLNMLFRNIMRERKKVYIVVVKNGVLFP